MRFFSLLAGAAFAAVAMAQASPVNLTNTVFNPEAGKTFTITYVPPTASVTINLKNGPSGNLKTVFEIGKSNTGSVTWTVPASLPADLYAIEIVPATGAPNYSGQFRVTGATGAPSSVATASSTGSASASSASSSSGSASRVTSSSASASASASASSNSTISSATLTSASSSSRASSTGAAGSSTGSSPPQSTGGAATLIQSPLALILGAAAAMAYLA